MCKFGTLKSTLKFGTARKVPHVINRRITISIKYVSCSSFGPIAMTDRLLREIFCRYSATKSVSDGDGIVSSMFMKMCREADLLNNTSFRKQEADILFAKMKEVNKFKMDYKSFKVIIFRCFDCQELTFFFLRL